MPETVSTEKKGEEREAKYHQTAERIGKNLVQTMEAHLVSGHKEADDDDEHRREQGRDHTTSGEEGPIERLTGPVHF
jgi:hypothetical protein